jgi:hypothetical protein
MDQNTEMLLHKILFFRATGREVREKKMLEER